MDTDDPEVFVPKLATIQSNLAFLANGRKSQGQGLLIIKKKPTKQLENQNVFLREHCFTPQQGGCLGNNGWSLVDGAVQAFL